MDKNSEEYKLATKTAMFLADRLNAAGIKTVVVSQEEARQAVETEPDRTELSVRDIQRLSYTWNGEEVSLQGFAEQFMGQIKQSDRTIEDAERIAKAFIESVKADPEAAGMKMLKAENMSNAFRFRLPDGSIYSPAHPMAESPEYQTQKALWHIYERVLGQDKMKEFISLLSKKTPMTEEERVRYSAMESRVNASDLMQRSLEVPASKVNENRVKDIRNLIQYFEENNDYTWTEKALIVKGSMTYGFSEKKVDGETQVDVKNISDNNSVAVPVIGGEAAAVVEGLRKGLNFKESLKQARIELSKTTTRSVPRNFTGWKVYKQSDREEDAVILNRDAAGTGWCTGNAVSTARSHLSGGDFHIYFEAGEPLIAVRTQDGYMAEPPRGAHEGQFCTRREEDIAFDYILGNKDIVAGVDYIADIKDIRKIMSPEATAFDAFVFNEERRYANGEFGGDTRAWGKAVEDRVKSLLIENVDERHAQGLYRSEEIDWNDEEALKNIRAITGNVVIPDGFHGELPNCLYIKGDISVGRSSKFSIPNVLETGDIYVCNNSSISVPKLQKTRDIVLGINVTLSLPEVQKTGSIYVHENGSLSLPKVQKTGSITVHENGSLSLPEAQMTVGIEVHENGSLSLPKVRETGYIEVNENGSLSLPKVRETGDIRVCENASLSLPKVQKTGDIYVGKNGSLSLPMAQITWDIEVCENVSFSVPEVWKTGKIYVHENASLSLPKVKNTRDIEVNKHGFLSLPEALITEKIYVHEHGSLSLPNVQMTSDITVWENGSLSAPNVQMTRDISVYHNGSLSLPKVRETRNIWIYKNGFLSVQNMQKTGDIRVSETGEMILLDGIILKKGFYYASKIRELLNINQKKEEFSYSDGTIYGYQVDDTIYLTPEGINPNTPIHEYAHIWVKAYQHLRPESWERLKDNLKENPIWEATKNNDNYTFLANDENRLAGEVLATIVGNKGEELLIQAAGESKGVEETVEKFRKQISDFALKEVLGVNDPVKEATWMTLADFVEGNHPAKSLKDDLDVSIERLEAEMYEGMEFKITDKKESHEERRARLVEESKRKEAKAYQNHPKNGSKNIAIKK